jgi:hypothetical protein
VLPVSATQGYEARGSYAISLSDMPQIPWLACIDYGIRHPSYLLSICVGVHNEVELLGVLGTTRCCEMLATVVLHSDSHS